METCSHSKEDVGHILFHGLHVVDDIWRLVDACALSSQNGLIDSKAT